MFLSSKGYRAQNARRERSIGDLELGIDTKRALQNHPSNVQELLTKLAEAGQSLGPV